MWVLSRLLSSRTSDKTGLAFLTDISKCNLNSIYRLVTYIENLHTTLICICPSNTDLFLQCYWYKVLTICFILYSTLKEIFCCVWSLFGIKCHTNLFRQNSANCQHLKSKGQASLKKITCQKSGFDSSPCRFLRSTSELLFGLVTLLQISTHSLCQRGAQAACGSTFLNLPTNIHSHQETLL